MVEFVGLIKVNVVKGTNLAVRDVMTSDPYVILSLGQQVSSLEMIFRTKLFMETKQGLFLDVGEVGKNKGDQEQLESCVE